MASYHAAELADFAAAAPDAAPTAAAPAAAAAAPADAAAGTAATRALDDAGVSYTTHQVVYETKPEGVNLTLHFARQCGLDDDLTMLKTMVFDVGGEEPVLVLMPGNLNVDKKAMAKLFDVGVKKVRPCDAAKAEEFTGYQFGGTTSVGTRRKLRTLVHAPVLDLPTVFINGGSRSMCLSVRTADLVRLVGPEPHDLAAAK
eukprot:TRINITY_DN20585_c0_g1_i2.p2 TRINITY_DN20585_c0_g1~~TRINITY_DN20585_c0_g1_i2.p2  ORF type:complete len:201 (+),score=63.23 TRINITY_DN20585_c0_g1_i2:217-819(+)